MNSNYLERFRGAEEKRKGKLHSDLILIEIPKEELYETKSGIIIAESDHARSDFMMFKGITGIVLEVGKGYYNPEDGGDIPLSTRPGNVIWANERSIIYCTTIPGLREGIPDKALALISEGEIKKSWDSIEDYQFDMELMNESRKNS